MWSTVPVVLHEWVEVICVGVLLDILAGPVDVWRHVSAAAERLVVHIVCVVLTTRETAIHTLERERVKGTVPFIKMYTLQ